MSTLYTRERLVPFLKDFTTNKGGLTQVTPIIKNPKPMTPIVTVRDLPYSAMVRVARVASQFE